MTLLHNLTPQPCSVVHSRATAQAAADAPADPAPADDAPEAVSNIVAAAVASSQ